MENSRVGRGCNHQEIINIKYIKGYIYVRIDNYWIREHRYIVENFIGRKLKPNEVIHHINGNRKDNRIQNLMIFDSQAKHKSFENRVTRFGFTRPIMREIRDRWIKYKN